jgi:16S rRNA (cytidine1402-2'-O)-methyltransferase
MKRNKSFTKEDNLLYLVATPIGNLSEFTNRAIEVLSVADLIAAEDTRNTKQLLSHFGIHKDLFSLREHNEIEASKHIINLIKNGKNVAYVSDAGYPGISDPGYLLVKEAINNDICVSTICGSCAFINALVASGLPTDHFYFHGFLPAKPGDATKELKELQNKKETLIFYESPHRIIKTLEILLSVLGDREAVVARELTKLNEEYIRGTLSELVKIDQESLKGEMVVLIKGNEKEESLSDDFLLAKVGYFIEKGLTTKSAIEVVCDIYNVQKNYLRNLVNSSK